MEEWRVENALLLGHEVLGPFDNSCLRLTPWIKQFPVFSSSLFQLVQLKCARLSLQGTVAFPPLCQFLTARDQWDCRELLPGLLRYR